MFLTSSLRQAPSIVVRSVSRALSDCPVFYEPPAVVVSYGRVDLVAIARAIGIEMGGEMAGYDALVGGSIRAVPRKEEASAEPQGA